MKNLGNRRGREEEARKPSEHFQKWLTKPGSDDGAGTSEAESALPEISHLEEEVKEELDTTIVTADVGQKLETDTDNTIISEETEFPGLKFKDPLSCPHLTDKVRCYLVRHCPE